MLEWMPVHSGHRRWRPVPAPAATPSVWALMGAAALAVVGVFNFLGHQDATADLVALSLVVALISGGARLAAAPGSALLCWAVLNAFATPPMGVITWAAPYDLTRIACLLTAAALGTAVARLTHARAAHRRLIP
ncbi:hypothetical protein [Streptomyces sp. NPDC097619]|uniref:hypothetical protein n=1 Tax=Streptomyces sp. NPDC097619 TaxID=3157228 RepID=UPI00331D5B13